MLDTIQGKVTISKPDGLTYGLAPSEIENWVGDAKRSMKNALRASPLDVKKHYERQTKSLQEAYGEAVLDLRARKVSAPAGQRREMIETIRLGLNGRAAPKIKP